ncbi:MAG TPA: hypothetical protein VKV28_15840 [Candidatus Binataceae bacterium]|nr:hypothetical protein [Candidatus Binataceae bacterium]
MEALETASLWRSVQVDFMEWQQRMPHSHTPSPWHSQVTSTGGVEAGGAHALCDDDPVQRAFRDIHALNAHIALQWYGRALSFGRLSLGLSAGGPGP